MLFCVNCKSMSLIHFASFFCYSPYSALDSIVYPSFKINICHLLFLLPLFPLYSPCFLASALQTTLCSSFFLSSVLFLHVSVFLQLGLLLSEFISILLSFTSHSCNYFYEITSSNSSSLTLHSEFKSNFSLITNLSLLPHLSYFMLSLLHKPLSNNTCIN